MGLANVAARAEKIGGASALLADVVLSDTRFWLGPEVVYGALILSKCPELCDLSVPAGIALLCERTLGPRSSVIGPAR